MKTDLHPEFLRALKDNIPTSGTAAFALFMEEQLRQVVDRKRDWGIGTSELKLLIRRQCRTYDIETAGSVFSDGAYFCFFPWLHGKNESDRELLLQALERLAELSELLDDQTQSAADTSSRVIRTWGRLMRPGSPLEASPATQLMLWRVLESMVKGEVEVVPVRWGDSAKCYPRFATPQRLAARRRDQRRSEILSILRFTLGCASLRRPALTKLLEGHNALSVNDRTALIKAVTSQDPATAEPISALLRHHIELLALADYDRLETFSSLIHDFVDHLRDHVLTDTRSLAGVAMSEYLKILKTRYFPGLFNYSRILREACRGSAFLGDLLQESYLIRTRSLDGDDDVPFARLLQDWSAVQRVIETRVVVPTAKGFSFTQAYLKEAMPTDSKAGSFARSPHSPHSGPPGPSRESVRAGTLRGYARGKTQRGHAQRALDEFETLVTIEPPETDQSTGTDDATPPAFDETSDTLTFRRPTALTAMEPATDPDPLLVSDAALAPWPDDFESVVPARLSSLDDLYTAPTEIFPVVSDDDSDIHSSVTEILPVTETGEIDLRRIATEILPSLNEQHQMIIFEDDEDDF